jgi:hypothetical protein
VDQGQKKQWVHLRKLWDQWTRIVARVADRGGVPSHDEYARLHRKLLVACKSAFPDANASQRQIQHRLEELISPWVSLESLEHSDRQIVRNLHSQCRQIQHDLFHEHMIDRRTVRLSMVVITVVLILPLCLAAIALDSGLALTGLGDKASDMFYRATKVWDRIDLSAKLAILTVTFVVFGIWMACSVRKS